MYSGDYQNFDLPFDFMKDVYSKQADNWSMEGRYHSYTLVGGQTRLQFEGSLRAPSRLEAFRTHIIELHMGSKYQKKSEWFAAGQQVIDKRQMKSYYDTS